jgi:hypothetical protein
MIRIVLLTSIFLVSAVAVKAADDTNAIAERYVHLVLALGQRDADYVDAFTGRLSGRRRRRKKRNRSMRSGPQRRN